MSKLWQVALHEYTRHVLNRRFLFGLLSAPFVIGLIIGLIFLIMATENNATPLGYVDHSGLLADPVPPPPPDGPFSPVPMLAYGDESQAQAALDDGKIQAYYVLPADYLKTGKVKVVYHKAPKEPAREQFYSFLAANLLADQPPEIAARLVAGSNVNIESADGSRQMSSQGWFNILLPFFIGIAFLIGIFSAGGYLLQAVVEEKENRTMEVIMTSVSANQFMAGKILADIAIGLTQIFGWAVFIVVAILVGQDYITFLKGISVPWDMVGLTLAVMLPAFVMVSALMATVGATVTESREGQQVVGLISLPLWIPYMLIALIMTNPNGPVVVGLSLFPLTAPLTMVMRAGFTIIPAWQLAASVIILTLSAIGAVWLAGRAFRLGMLRYGKQLTLREIFARQE
jgi:ABC-2 type transport system permease protein